MDFLSQLANLLNDPRTDPTLTRWSEDGNSFCVNARLIDSIPYLSTLSAEGDNFSSFSRRLNLRGIYEVGACRGDVKTFKSRYEPIFTRRTATRHLAQQGLPVSPAKSAEPVGTCEDSHSNVVIGHLQAALAVMQSQMLEMSKAAELKYGKPIGQILGEASITAGQTAGPSGEASKGSTAHEADDLVWM